MAKKRKPLVYVVNDSGHDFSKAHNYGTLKFMSSGIVNKYHLSRMYREMTQAMEESRPGDYIIPCGPNIMNIIACTIFAVKHKRLNMLIWRSDTHGNDRYISRKLRFLENDHIEVTEEEEEINE
jgi:hypothetical protein